MVAVMTTSRLVPCKTPSTCGVKSHIVGSPSSLTCGQMKGSARTERPVALESVRSGQPVRRPTAYLHRDDDGTLEYLADGVLTSAEGWTRWMPDGTQERYCLGARHSATHSAVTLSDGTQIFWSNGICEGVDVPDGQSVRYRPSDRSLPLRKPAGSVEHYYGGARSKVGEPAVETPDGTKEYWLDGGRHRPDGAAIEWADGYKEWYWEGIRLTEEEHAAKAVKAPILGMIKRLFTSSPPAVTSS